MSEKTKTRKGPQNQPHKNKNHDEQGWRHRVKANTASKRYTRDIILNKYSPSESLPIPVPESLSSLFLPISCIPSSSQEGFPHGLGDTVNSRKPMPREKGFVRPVEAEEEHVEEKKKEESLWEDDDNVHKREEVGEKKYEEKKEFRKNKPEKGSHKNVVEGDGKKKEGEKKKMAWGERKEEIEVVKHEEKDEKNKNENKTVDKNLTEGIKNDKQQKVDEVKRIEEGKDEKGGKGQKVQNEEKEVKEVKDIKGVVEEKELKEYADIKESKEPVVLEVSEVPKESNEPKAVVWPREPRKPKVINEPKGLKEPKGAVGHKELNEPKGPIESKESKGPKGSKELKKPIEQKAPVEVQMLEIKVPIESKIPIESKTSIEPKASIETKEAKGPKKQKKPKKPKEPIASKVNKSEDLKEPEETVKQELKTQEIKPEIQKIIVPAYDKNSLLTLINQGNPFAKAMLYSGTKGENDEKIYFPPGSKIYERMWFYKDPSMVIQGPFNCLEMFNWTNRGLFPEDLEISFCNTEFLPMNAYLKTPKKSQIGASLPKTEAQNPSEAKNPGAKNPWFSPNKNMNSLQDIQKEQQISKK